MMPFITLIISLFVLSSYAFGAGDHGDATVEMLIQSDKSWDGRPLPTYPAEPPQISVIKVTVPPHSKLKWHKHPVINAGYLISGELVVEAEDGSVHIIKSGDAIIELVDTFHYGRNEGDTSAEIVVFYAGVKGAPLSIIQEDQ
ncbi:MAG: cupin domain-containing protein [Verrucomicrobiota bacterium]